MSRCLEALAHSPRSYGFTESLEDFTRANSEQRRTFDERLHRSSALIGGVNKSLDTTYSNYMNETYAVKQSSLLDDLVRALEEVFHQTGSIC